MKWFLALALLCAPGFAQQKKAPARNATAQKWPIASLSVDGLKNYSQQQALAVAGLKIGQLAGTADFDAARDRLLAAGLFETVGYRFAPAAGSSGYAASFQVVEVAPVYPVRLEGLNAPETEITAWLGKQDPFFGPKIPATTAILKRNVAAIEQYLASKGRNEKIEAKVVADSPEQFAIVFRPASGAPKVAEVRFRGNTVVPSSVLLNNFAGIAYGTIYSESAFRQMLDASVRPIYDARGRIRVAFPKLETEKAKDVEGLVVTVTVDEGETYDLGEVRLDGESPVPEKQLLKVGGFKSGDLANFDDVTAGLDRMKKRLRREGYMRVALQVERHIDDQKKTVALRIRPELGPQFLFGTLTIEGLDIHGEAAVRKMWGIKEGKPFDGDYPDYFLQQVREQGLFDDLGPTHSASKVNEESHLVDVTLTFQASKGSDAGSPTRLRRRDR
jgi:outer membrane protein insertion porin family